MYGLSGIFLPQDTQKNPDLVQRRKENLKINCHRGHREHRVFKVECREYCAGRIGRFQIFVDLAFFDSLRLGARLVFSGFSVPSVAKGVSFPNPDRL